MEIKELITTYWSQITIILFGLGYFVKSFLNLIFKKKEINHSLFQNRRLDSANNFFTAYSKTEQMWDGLSIYEILNNKIKEEEIDRIIFTSIDLLKSSVLEIQIYFEEVETVSFEKVLKNTESISQKLMYLYLDENQNLSTIKKANEFTTYKNQVTNENKLILKKICHIIKKNLI